MTSGAAKSRRFENRKGAAHARTICGLDAMGKGDVAHQAQTARLAAVFQPARRAQLDAAQRLGVRREIGERAGRAPGVLLAETLPLEAMSARSPAAVAVRRQSLSPPAHSAGYFGWTSWPIAFITSAIVAPRSTVGVGNSGVKSTAGPPMLLLPIMSAISVHS